MPFLARPWPSKALNSSEIDPLGFHHLWANALPSNRTGVNALDSTASPPRRCHYLILERLVCGRFRRSHEPATNLHARRAKAKAADGPGIPNAPAAMTGTSSASTTEGISRVLSSPPSVVAPSFKPFGHYRVYACCLRFQSKLHAADNVHHTDAMRFQVLSPGFGVARTGEHNRHNSTIVAMCSSIDGYNNGTFTAKGRSVATLYFRI